MILKAIPKEIVTEAIQKRYKDPIQVMLLIMIKYQPGSRREREVILNQIGYLKLDGMRKRHSRISDFGRGRLREQKNSK